MLSTTQRIRGLLKSIPPTLVWPILPGAASCSSVWSGNKALVNAGEGLLEPLQNGFQFEDDVRELFQREKQEARISLAAPMQPLILAPDLGYGKADGLMNSAEEVSRLLNAYARAIPGFWLPYPAPF